MAINKEYDDVQLDVKFTQASTRANLVSEENISVSFGKLAKWYEALVPTGGSSGKILAWNSSGTAKWSDPLHPTITKSADTTSTASPAHGGTFTTVDSVTRDANGHVTKINTKTVTLPSDQNTDTLMTQTNTTTSADYRVLLSGNANDTTETTTGRKSTNLKFNPSSGGLYSFGFLWTDITGQTLDINTLTLSNGTLHSRRFIEKTDGGAANITNIPVTGKPFLLEVDLIRWGSTTDYITRQRFTNAANGTYSYVRYCTNGTWGSWTTRKYTDTDTKVTSSANHYTPATASGQDKTASASEATAAWGINVVKGVTLNTDGKGHVTGISVTSGKIPANPVPSNAKFTDENVKQTPTTSSNTSYRPVLVGMDYGDPGYTATEKTDAVYTVPRVMIKPSTGDLVLYSGGDADSPSLTFQRGTPSDGTYDWKLYVTGGHLNFNRNNAGTWTNLVQFEKTGKLYVSGTIYSNNTPVSLDGHTHNYAGSSSTGGPATYVELPRVTADSKSFPGQNKVGFKEYSNTSTNTPSSAWYHIISMQGDDTRYGTQLALGMTTNAVYYRNYNNSTWIDWQPLGRFTTTPTTGQVVITDGTTGGIKSSGYTIAKSVPSNAVFTDHITTVTSSGSGNAVTDISADANGALMVTKGSTFSLSTHTHTTTIAADSGTNQLTLAASTKYKLTTGGTNFIFTTPPNTTYSAGTGLSLSGTTFNHSNSVTAVTSAVFKKITYDAQGHITGTANVTASDIPSHTHSYLPLSGTTINNPNTSSVSFTNGMTGNILFTNTGNTNGVARGIGGIVGTTDSWSVRGYQTGDNKGCLEIAVGDDGDEGIYVRQYTSGAYKATFSNNAGSASGLTYRELVLMAPSTGASTFPSDVTLSGGRLYLSGSPGNYGQLNLKSASYNVMFRNDNANTYILLTAQGDPDGAWTSSRPLMINNSTGVCSINGNAATSSAWTTARTLTLSGQLTGSVSVKGDANMTLSGWLKKSFIYDDTSDFASYAWHKFAEKTITNANEDQTITFVVSKTWGDVPRCSGILTAHIRANSTKVHESSQFYWQLANSEIDPEDFVFVYTNTANTSCKVELWYKQSNRWDGWVFSVLKEHSRTSNNNVWTLYTSTGHGSASHTTGTASYASSIAGIQNNTSGTSSNVTGTVAIANGGTGATTRLAALRALTEQDVGTSAQYFLTITNSWGKGGYTSVANAKTVLGLKSAAYTESSDYIPNTQAGMNAAINLLSTGSSTPGLADYYVSQYVNGGTTATSYHRRPISSLWNAFKELITLTTTGSGNAVTGVSIANDGDNNRKIAVTKGSTFSLSTHTHSNYLPMSTVSSSTDADTLFTTSQWINWNTTTEVETTHMPTTNYGILLAKAYPGIQVFIPDSAAGIYFRKKTNANTAATAWWGITGTSGSTYNLANFLTSSTQYISSIASSGSGNAVTSMSVSGGKLTYTLGSTFSLSTHKHGLLHSGLNQASTNGTTGGWSVIGIDPAVTGYVLKSIRVNTTSPNWLSGDFGAGIAFGGSDTKGVISMKYQSPVITFAGGNHSSSKTEPVWYLKISGTSGNTYNLANFYDSATSRTANTVLAAPNGSNGGATFRKLVAEDLPSHTHNYAGSSSAGGAATSANKLNTNDGATNRPVYFSGGVPVQCDTPWTSSWFKGVPLITTGGVMEIGKIIDFHKSNDSTADYDLRLQYTGTATGKTVTIPGASGYVALLAKGGTSFYGMMDGDGTTSGWIRATSNGFIPSAEARFFQTATSSLGTNTWYFKNSYIQNMTANRLVLGAAKTTDGAAKGQVKFFSGNANDATGTVTLECINDSARTGDYTVKLPTWNGTIPVFEKLFEGASNNVSLSFSDINEYDLFLITVANSNATTEQVTVASLWISNIAGVHDMPLIWGGTPSSSGGACNVTSGWIQLTKNSGTTTFVVAHKTNVAQMTSSGWTISSPTYNLYIRKIFGLKTYKRT